jgi:flagellar motor switch protein FliN/FliY
MTETSVAVGIAQATEAEIDDLGERTGDGFIGNQPGEIIDPAVTTAAASFDNAERRAPARPANTGDRLELLGNVEMDITAELGRTRMTVRELLSLAPGTVVELDRAAGSPVDLFVNGTLIARGEVVVVDEEFGVRVSEIISSDNTDSSGHSGRT